MAKELSEDTTFKMSVKTMGMIATGIAILVGGWYSLMQEIQEAKELPTLESLYESEYPSKPQGYNHPASYEQYKSQVGALQENQDDIFQMVEELQEDIDELKQQVIELRIKVK